MNGGIAHMVYFSESTEPPNAIEKEPSPNSLEKRKRLKRTLLAILIELLVISTAIAVVLAKRKSDVVPIE